jgi:CheY-like chemotaxis protein
MATILIVDDDPALRDGISETMGDFGHASRLAGSGREALRILAAEKIDGVLLDLHMPGDIDGIEVLRRVREHEPPRPLRC